jgi:hypothetical protein
MSLQAWHPYEFDITCGGLARPIGLKRSLIWIRFDPSNLFPKLQTP